MKPRIISQKRVERGQTYRMNCHEWEKEEKKDNWSHDGGLLQLNFQIWKWNVKRFRVYKCSVKLECSKDQFPCCTWAWCSVQQVLHSSLYRQLTQGVSEVSLLSVDLSCQSNTNVMKLLANWKDLYQTRLKNNFSEHKLPFIIGDAAGIQLNRRKILFLEQSWSWSLYLQSFKFKIFFQKISPVNVKIFYNTNLDKYFECIYVYATFTHRNSGN